MYLTTVVNYVAGRVVPYITRSSISTETKQCRLTVKRLEELNVFTQYLFQSDSSIFLSNADLKYETSRE